MYIIIWIDGRCPHQVLYHKWKFKI